MKLQHLFDSYLADLTAVADHYKIDVEKSEGGKTGLLTMYNLLEVARRNRAYDDQHPAFANKHWPRILPFNGTEYCEYYQNNCNDTHLATLLKAIKARMIERKNSK